MTTDDKLAVSQEALADDRADWLLDAVAGATQDRRFLRGDPAYDEVAGEAILRNAKKAILVALARFEAQARLAGERADKWQDIASAPKDGTAILITRPTCFEDEEAWHVVRWDDDWWQVHCGKFDHPLRGPDPTHWQPLPEPPAKEQTP